MEDFWSRYKRSPLLIIYSILIVAFFLFILSIFCSSSKAPKRRAKKERSVVKEHGKLGLAYKIYKFLSQNSTSLKIKFKALAIYGQIVSKISFNCSIRFPWLFEVVIVPLNIFQLDFIPALGLQCEFSRFDFVSKIIVVTVVPIGAAFVLGIMWVVLVSAYRKKNYAVSKEQLLVQDIPNKWIRALKAKGVARLTRTFVYLALAEEGGEEGLDGAMVITAAALKISFHLFGLDDSDTHVSSIFEEIKGRSDRSRRAKEDLLQRTIKLLVRFHLTNFQPKLQPSWEKSLHHRGVKHMGPKRDVFPHCAIRGHGAKVSHRRFQLMEPSRCHKRIGRRHISPTHKGEDSMNHIPILLGHDR